jgi:RNA polymerase sigma factor (TIGR02999 family)
VSGPTRLVVLFFSSSLLLSSPDKSVTQLLAEWRAGSDAALDQVIPLLYEEMRRIATMYLRSSHPQTLQATALVHEFFLKTPGLREVEWENRSHFLATAAKVMRNIVVDQARRRAAGKRGAGLERVTASGIPVEDPLIDVLAIDQALGRFELEYPRHAKVVELLYFGGLKAEEAAQVLSASGSSISTRTVERDWRFARAWLFRELYSAEQKC